jgi:hypothetical protein
MSLRRADRARAVLALIEAVMGLLAVGGGLALAFAPDGHLLTVDPSLLAQTPFADYFVPGLLLAGFVGMGGLLGSELALRQVRLWVSCSVLYGSGLIIFELAEYELIGFQVLQPVVGVLASAIVALALAAARGQPVNNSSRQGSVLGAGRGKI